jgi:hypothetical protein
MTEQMVNNTRLKLEKRLVTLESLEGDPSETYFGRPLKNPYFYTCKCYH